MLIGLWLSRPRVHDKVAVASVISSTITTPGGPGGPGEKMAALKRNKGKGMRGGCSVLLCLSLGCTSDVYPSWLLSDTLMSTHRGMCCYLHMEKKNFYTNRKRQEHDHLNGTRIRFSADLQRVLC